MTKNLFNIYLALTVITTITTPSFSQTSTESLLENRTDDMIKILESQLLEDFLVEFEEVTEANAEIAGITRVLSYSTAEQNSYRILVLVNLEGDDYFYSTTATVVKTGNKTQIIIGKQVEDMINDGPVSESEISESVVNDERVGYDQSGNVIRPKRRVIEDQSKKVIRPRARPEHFN